MADEYRFYNAAIEVLSDAPAAPAPGVLVYDTAIEVLSDVVILPEYTFFNVGIEVLSDLVDIELEPAFFDDEAVESETVFLPSFSQTGIAYKGPEINPYRPSIPSELWDKNPILARFMREQSEILRQQHNLIQAGDTTFPWELLTNYALEADYNLGSLGRFYHVDYGVILARYVQFSSWVAAPAPVSPVGLIAGADSQDWIVTNDFSLSRSDLVQGVAFLQSEPTQDSYGWAVVQGANPLNVQAIGIPDRVNEPYTWAGDGFLQAGGEGTVVGTRRPNRNDAIIAAGEFYIDVQGLSDESIIALVQDDLDSLQVQITQHNVRLAIAEGDIDDVEALSASNSTSIAALTVRLTAEEQTRSEQVDQLFDLLAGGAITQAELDSAILTVTLAYQGDDNGLSVRIDAAHARADAAYALAAGIDSVGINVNLAALNTGLATANTRILTLEVAGAYPPQLGFMGW